MSEYPTKMTPELVEVLSLMMWQTGPLAHALRSAGQEIPRKGEAEQAIVLHWLIGLALTHGPAWRDIVGSFLTETAERARAAAIPEAR
jgi:hypothetical protein